MTTTPPAKTEQKPGPMMEALAQDAPKIMAELMTHFIERRDLNSRAQIRLRMKALLDLFSADTGYPAIPSISTARMDRDGFGPVQQAPAYVRPAPPLHAAGEVDLLQREVERAVGEERAAAPEGVFPAPGAPLAEPEPA